MATDPRRLPATERRREYLKPGGTRLVSSSDAVKAQGQHTKPCADCPWARTALEGWLGGSTVDEWIACAHSEALIKCHTLNGAQCAGAAIYRANVGKRPRDPKVLILPADRQLVFAWVDEFRKHHEEEPKR